MGAGLDRLGCCRCHADQGDLSATIGSAGGGVTERRLSHFLAQSWFNFELQWWRAGIFGRCYAWSQAFPTGLNRKGARL